MKNPCYEVYKNGTLLCKAGLDTEAGVLTGILTWVRRTDGSESNTLSVSGLNSQENISLSWVDEQVEAGDEITIKVTDDTEFSEASIRPPFDAERHQRDKIKAYYRLKEELKDYLKDEGLE
ncbi:hypothetical protein B0I27_11718 [Arcticibacter pallidicorallinus]|uniref:Uncharacterized protein n=1 Tax=Arcticibacter pallidicorallinus TaxID=1259464 RepID=A0A2T0TQW8_9SPHI|nr:hypothetical protein [Arcticibacter pallidicorallinus]PRY48031.1 hypothetical protein B0I27_11718 [Arcticibacter pallidicorallinus]